MKEAEAALRLAIKGSEDAKTREEVRLTGPALAACYNNHAVVLASIGGALAEEAAGQLRKALELEGNGGSDVALANVGLLLLSGRLGEAEIPAAITRLRELVSRRPNVPMVHHALGAALHRQSHPHGLGLALASSLRCVARRIRRGLCFCFRGYSSAATRTIFSSRSLSAKAGPLTLP